MSSPANLDEKIIPAIHEPADATAAVVTIAAPGAGSVVRIHQITFSYDVAAGGVETLTVVAGSTTIFSLDIPNVAGIWDIPFIGGLTNNTENEAVVVTLSAPGGSAQGRLNVRYST